MSVTGKTIEQVLEEKNVAAKEIKDIIEKFISDNPDLTVRASIEIEEPVFECTGGSAEKKKILTGVNVTINATL